MPVVYFEGAVLKILYVITGLGMGGAEQVVMNLAEQAEAMGHKVDIAYLTGEVVSKPTSQSIELHNINMKGYTSLFIAFFKLSSLIKKLQPDVVHSHMVHANILCRLVRFKVEFPRLICTIHSSNEGGALRMLAYRLTHTMADFTTNVSVEAAKVFELKKAAPKGGILAIPNGINTEYFQPIDEKKMRAEIGKCFNIISVGRLEKVKDYSMLLRALSILLNNNIKIKLKIVGDGSEKEALKKLAIELRINKYVEWLGIRRDLPKLFNDSDLFVITSEYEGFGLVAAEAMACSLPVISTDNGGVPEVLGSDEWVVQVADEVALVAKIKTIIELGSKGRGRIGEANRARVINNYSLLKMFESYLNIYR